MSESKPDEYSDHWRLLFPPSEFLAWQELRGQDVTMTIKSVSHDDVAVAGTGKKEKVAVVRFAEREKKLALNKTNARMITKLLGSPKTSLWIGKKITLYPDPSVMFGGQKVGGIRIRGGK